MLVTTVGPYEMTDPVDDITVCGGRPTFNTVRLTPAGVDRTGNTFPSKNGLTTVVVEVEGLATVDTIQTSVLTTGGGTTAGRSADIGREEGVMV